MSDSLGKKPVVVIHPYVDLDACACVAFSGTDVDEVRFLPGHVTERPADLAEARFLDHPLGIKGESDENGLVHAACLMMPEVADLKDSPLLREIDCQDTFGWSTARYNLATLVTALRSEFKAQGLEGEALDRAILRCMVPVIRGLARLERERGNKKVRTISIGPWRFVLQAESSFAQDQAIGELAAEEDESRPVGVVYHEGDNLGIARFAPFTEPDLRPLAPSLPGWFAHPAGFLACWGSNKAPRFDPLPSGTPQNWVELVQLVQNFLLGSGISPK